MHACYTHRGCPQKGPKATAFTSWQRSSAQCGEGPRRLCCRAVCSCALGRLPSKTGQCFASAEPDAPLTWLSPNQGAEPLNADSSLHTQRNRTRACSSVLLGFPLLAITSSKVLPFSLHQSTPSQTFWFSRRWVTMSVFLKCLSPGHSWAQVP